MLPKATTFVFDKYSFDAKKRIASFYYKINFENTEPLEFKEELHLPRGTRKFTKDELDKFLEPLHFALGISYYKLYLPSKVEIKVKFSEKQADFWNTVYRKGLGEFLYRNNLDPKQVAKFPFVKKPSKKDLVQINSREHALIGIGGGKDSIVGSELLKENNIPVTSFVMETQKSYENVDMVLKVLGNPVVKVKRFLDKQIFTKHPGSYDGHIPISSIYAFVGLLCSALYEYKYMVVANEYSSSFGNLNYRGEEINHQWSKSIEFESLLQDYISENISKDVTYVSALRQFYEIRIVKLFSQYKKYFHVFTSCNRTISINNQYKDSLWCGECAKCAFGFLMLAAFLPKKEVENIFKKNLFANEENIQMYKDLLGLGNMKPFDCVGTFEESQAAMYLAKDKFKNDVVIKELVPLIKDPEKKIENVLKAMPVDTLPTPFKFLGAEKVCILGYGKEGKVTEKYLKKNYPKLKVDILDEKDDKEYLLKQKHYDLAIKTPGIHKDKVTIPYTTATNIFFSQVKNLTIGVTGTKGKSTTSSLIYHILETAGKKVKLVGNIGTPMLSVLLNKIDQKEIFVLELSSYQLDDIEYSPNIGVFLNIYEGHSEFHGGFENYKKAKENIFVFQKVNDVAIKPPFSSSKPLGLKEKDIPLIGKHNIQNINAAIRVAKHLKISDANIKKAIKTFKPLPHRLENIGEFNGVTFYDDSIGVTPQSTIAALESLKKVDTLFLGGSNENFDFKELEKVIRKMKVRNIVLFPENGKKMLKSRKDLNVLETKDMYEAVEFAFLNTKKGKICLLSTATNSYGLWKNFEEKGSEFQRAIRKISGKNH